MSVVSHRMKFYIMPLNFIQFWDLVSELDNAVKENG
jgi:hypothetical protein